MAAHEFQRPECGPSEGDLSGAEPAREQPVPPARRGAVEPSAELRQMTAAEHPGDTLMASFLGIFIPLSA